MKHFFNNDFMQLHRWLSNKTFLSSFVSLQVKWRCLTAFKFPYSYEIHWVKTSSSVKIYALTLRFVFRSITWCSLRKLEMNANRFAFDISREIVMQWTGLRVNCGWSTRAYATWKKVFELNFCSFHKKLKKKKLKTIFLRRWRQSRWWKEKEKNRFVLATT